MKIYINYTKKGEKMNMPIRVLQVGMSSNPGGVESFVMNIYRHINREKLQFDFLCLKDLPIAHEEEIKDLGGNIYKEIYRAKKKPLMYFCNLDVFFKKHPEFSAIHHHVNSLSYVEPGRYAKKYGIPKRILHSHNSNHINGKPSLPRKVLENVNQHRIDHFITDYLACSSVAGKWMFGEREFKVINNGIDISKYAYNPSIREQKRLELGLKPEHFVIGVVGRIQYQKNPEFIVEIFKKIYEKEKNAVLLWVGDGDLRPQMEQKIMEYGLKQNVKLLGIRKDVNEIYQTMDVFLLPSRFEGLGIVLIEAQAAGLKCFTSAEKVPNEAKITNLVNYISLQKSADFWAEQILRTKNDHERKDQTEAIRNAGYDIKTIIKELEKIYLEIK